MAEKGEKMANVNLLTNGVKVTIAEQEIWCWEGCAQGGFMPE